VSADRADGVAGGFHALRRDHSCGRSEYATGATMDSPATMGKHTRVRQKTSFSPLLFGLCLRCGPLLQSTSHSMSAGWAILATLWSGDVEPGVGLLVRNLSADSERVGGFVYAAGGGVNFYGDSCVLMRRRKPLGAPIIGRGRDRALSGGPPHRSVRAELPHTAPTLRERKLPVNPIWFSCPPVCEDAAGGARCHGFARAKRNEHGIGGLCCASLGSITGVLDSRWGERRVFITALHSATHLPRPYVHAP